MTLADFIDQNRAELTACIGRVLGRVPRQASCSCPLSGTDHYHPAPALDDDEIEDWINNDAGLYSWALRERVDLNSDDDEEGE